MITVGDVVERLAAKVVAGEERLDRPVTGGYVGDLLSCVMAGASSGDLWITVQGHPNVVAVATLVGISAIVVAEGARIDPGTAERANSEGIPLLSSPRRSFSLVEGLVALGVKATD
jgi:hypothetical protein